MITVQLLLVLLALYLFARLVSYSRNQFRLYHQLKHLPGPEITSPLIGNLPIYWTILQQPNPMKAFIDKLTELSKIYEQHGFFRLWLGPFVPVVYICDSMLAKKVLSNPSHANKSTHYRLFDQFFFGKSIFSSSGHIARQERKAIMSFYKLNYLDWYVSKTQRNLINLTKKIDECIEKEGGRYQGVDLLVSTFVYDSLTENIFSRRFESILSGDTPPYLSSMHKLNETMGTFLILQPWRHSVSSQLLLYPINVLNHLFFSISVPVVRTVYRFNQVVFKLLYGRYRQLLNQQQHDFRRSQLDSLLVGRVLPAKSKLARLFGWIDALRFGLFFIVGGHDTITSTLCWTFYMLAHHPEAQHQAREEVEQFLEQLAMDGGKPNALNLRQLRYTECCIKEALRLYPVAPVIGRSGSKPISVDSRLTIPGHVDVLVFNDYTHRQEVYFDEPSLFRPERFRTSEAKQTFPYSLGERSCPGQGYSMVQMKLFLLTLLAQYEISPVDKLGDIKPEHHFLRFPPKFDVHFAKRKTTFCGAEVLLKHRSINDPLRNL